MGKTDVVVRRRAGLVALVTVLSGATAVGYAVSASRADDSTGWLVCSVTALICVVHAASWRASRHPLLVGDATGVRVRVGGGWAALPWESIERVEVEERRRLGDGRVSVVPRPGVLAADGRGWGSRLAIALNERVFDAPLVVPHGLSTTVSVVDIAGSLERLSAGQARVIRAADPTPLPEPTVELTGWTADPADDGAGRSVAAPEPTPPPRLRALLSAALPSTAAGRTVSAPLGRPAARRDELAHSGHAPAPLTLGGLALSDPVVEPVAPELPEIDELRRPTMDTGRAPRAEGNVSLIIDATTDLTAQAMQRVRRFTDPEPTRLPPQPVEDEAPPITVIGGELASARRRLDLTVDDLAARTRIRPYVIEHIEVDDFSPCGGDFYARGHLRNLARVLELDPRQLIEAYDDYFAKAPVSPREVFEAELATGPTGLGRRGEGGPNWLALAAVVVVLGLVWGLASYFTDTVDDAPATTAPTDSAGLGSPGPGNPPHVEPRISHVKVSAAGGDATVVVRDRFRQIVFSGVIPDGASRKLEGEAPLRVKAADGGLVALSSRGRDLGVMGDVGEPARQRVAAQR